MITFVNFVIFFVRQVDDYLHKLASLSSYPEKLRVITAFTKRCTVRDLIYFVRLIRQDLRINAGNKQMWVADITWFFSFYLIGIIHRLSFMIFLTRIEQTGAVTMMSFCALHQKTLPHKFVIVLRASYSHACGRIRLHDGLPYSFETTGDVR